MAENTTDPQGTPKPISADDVSARLQGINQYLDSNIGNVLAGIDEADQVRENYLALNGGNLIPSSYPKSPSVQSLIGGNIFQGPNPGLKLPSTDDLIAYGDAIANKLSLDTAQTADPYFFARATSFDASRYGYNFNRYYKHPNFKQLNFSIYRDNEALYNENSTWWDDFSRMRGQYMGLVGGAIVDTFKNWGEFGYMGASQSAREMEDRLSIATSSKEGIGAWSTNFLANSAYTVGTISEIFLESALLAAATRFAPGLAPMAAYKTGANIGRLGKSFKLLYETMKGADKARSFFKMAKGATLNALPFYETGKFINKARKLGTAENRLTDMAKLYHGFGSFYKEMRAINAVTAESRLEGGFAQNAVADKLLSDFYKENKRDPNDVEAKAIYDEAYAAGMKTTLLNIPAIYVSNQLVLGTALKGFKPVSNILSQTGMKNALFRMVKNEKGLYDVVARGFRMPSLSLQGLKSIPSKLAKGLKDAPLRTLGSGIRYFNNNLMEGMQELYQEGVQAGVIDYYVNDYYTKLYGDSYLAGKDALATAFRTGLSSQMSKQGLDVFLSGFLMGGAIQGPMQFVYNKGTLAKLKYDDYRNNTNKYEKYIKDQEESLQNIANALNDVIENRTKYVEWLDENVKLQRDLSADYDRNETNGDRNGVENDKDDSMFMHVATLAKSNKLDIFIEQLEGLKELKIDELREAFSDPTAEGDANNKDIYQRIDTAIAKAKQIKNIYETVNDKIDNPYNPDFIDKTKNPEQYAEEYEMYQGVEVAKMHAAFSEYTFMRSLERMESLFNKAGKYAPIKEVEGFYWSAIYGSFKKSIGKLGDIDAFKETLKTEIEVLKNGTPEQQEEGKKKQTILDAYSDLVVIMQNYKNRHGQIQRLSNPIIQAQVQEYADSLADQPVIDEATGQMSMFSDVDVSPDVKILAHINNEIRDAYNQYVKAIASATNTIENKNFIEDSVQNLIDFIILDNQAKVQARNVNMLADPQAMLVLAGKLGEGRLKLREKRAQLAQEGLKKFREYNLTNTLIQQIADLKIFFNPEDVEAFVNENKFPSNFVDGVTGNKISESDPRFNQILDLFESYEVETGKEIIGKPEKKAPVTPAAAPGTAPAAPAPAAPAGPPVAVPVTVTTPFEEITDESLKTALQSAYDKSGASGSIQEWMLESPAAAAIIDAYNKGIEVKLPVSPAEPPEEELVGTEGTVVQEYNLPSGLTRTIKAKITREDYGSQELVTADFETRSSDKPDRILSGSGYVYSQNSGLGLDNFLNDFGFTSIDEIKSIDPALAGLTYDNFKSLVVLTEKAVINKADNSVAKANITLSINFTGGTLKNKVVNIKKTKFTAPGGAKPAAPTAPKTPTPPAAGTGITTPQVPLPVLYERQLELSDDETVYIDPAQKDLPEAEREEWQRASDFKPHKYKKDDDDTSDNLDAQRGTIIDNVLRYFAVPLAEGTPALKDVMVRAHAGRTPSGTILGIETLEAAVRSLLQAAQKSIPGGTSITFNDTFVTNLTEALIDIAVNFKDYTWYTQVPTLYGNINNNNIAGTIDILLEKNGKYFIIDLKTSKVDRAKDYNEKESKYKDNDRTQLGIYAELFKQMTGIEVQELAILPMKVLTSVDKKKLTGVELTKRTGKGGKVKTTLPVDKIKNIEKLIKKGATPPKAKAPTPPPAAPADKKAEVERRIVELQKKLDVGKYDKEKQEIRDSLTKGLLPDGFRFGDSIGIVEKYISEEDRWISVVDNIMALDKNPIKAIDKYFNQQGLGQKISNANTEYKKQIKPFEEKEEQEDKDITDEQVKLLSTKEGILIRKDWSLGKGLGYTGEGTDGIIEIDEDENGNKFEAEYYLTGENDEWIENSYFLGKTKQEVIDKINAKYNEELAALGGAKPTQAPVSTKIEISSDRFSRESVTEDANTMYLFTDNAQRTSAPKATTENVDKNTWYYKKYKSQTDKPIHFGSLSNPTSAIIRGLNNAYPISTMSAYGTNWTDANFDLFKQTIDDEINQIKQDLSKFSKLKIGNYRIGQGGLKAKLPVQHQNYLDSKLAEIGIDNTGSTPKLITTTQAPVAQPEVKAKKAEVVRRLNAGETITGKIDRVPGARTKHTFTDTSGNVYEFYNAKGLDPVVDADINGIASLDYIGDQVINDKQYKDVVRVIVNGKTVGNIRESTEEEFNKAKVSSAKVNTPEHINTLNFTKLQLLATAFFNANPEQKKAYGKKVGESILSLTDEEFIELYLQRLAKLAEEGSIKPKSVTVGKKHIENVSGKKLPENQTVDNPDAVNRLIEEGAIQQTEEYKDVYEQVKDKPNEEVRDDFFNDLNNCNPTR